MSKNLKVAVVGDRESVLGFRALGLEVATPKTPDEARNAVDRLAREGSAVIFLTERLAEQIPETVERYIGEIAPAIILIPDRGGSLGLGRAAISMRVEKAVGRNILD